MRKMIAKAGFWALGLFWAAVWVDVALAIWVGAYHSILIGILSNPRGGPAIVLLCYLVGAGLMAYMDPDEL